jgi:hypothetical protein
MTLARRSRISSWRAAGAATLLSVALCGCGSGAEGLGASSTSGPAGGQPDAVNPPAPPIDTQLPPDLAEGLPRTDGGQPVVMTTNATLAPGVMLALTYDEKLDDPISRWGSCLSRVVGCYRTNGGYLGGCVDHIEVCGDPAGGDGCCPRGCLDRYKALRGQGVPEDTAVDGSFIAGDCIPGFTGPVQP